MILRVVPFPKMRATGLEMTIGGAVVRRVIKWEILDDTHYPYDVFHAVVDSMEKLLRRFVANEQ